MKWLLAFCIGALFVIMAASTSSAERNDAADNHRFVGAWRLVSLEEPDVGGNLHVADCSGLLVYTRDGHMSVQVMYRNAQAGSAATPVTYAQNGYEASFGTYEVNDAHTFTFHVQGALVRALVGKDLKRSYQFSAKQLIVKSPDPDEHWKAVWERY